jgi:hypothetical protein
LLKPSTASQAQSAPHRGLTAFRAHLSHQTRGHTLQRDDIGRALDVQREAVALDEAQVRFHKRIEPIVEARVELALTEEGESGCANGVGDACGVEGKA